MRLVANISLLFTEMPMTERFEAASLAGFDAVEILFPYDADISAIAIASQAAQMPMHLINTPPGDWQAGERGFAALPGPRFQASLDVACQTAHRLGATLVHVMAGNAATKDGVSTLCKNLRKASDHAPDLTFLLEPLNNISFPGYALSDFETAAHCLNETDRDNAGLQFDSFHAAMMGLDPIETLKRYAPLVRHVQIASSPDRTEPDPDEVSRFARTLGTIGYKGAVSAEYQPKGDTVKGLGWLQAFRDAC